MNKNIKHLADIAEKGSRVIIGLMSGTSLDGLDVALCEIKGTGLETELSLKNFRTIAYDDEFKNSVKEIFSKKIIELEKLCLLNKWIGTIHAAMINTCLKEWGIGNNSIDLIASHGQTIYHAPKSLQQQKEFGNATLQIGDADHIAVATGIITLSDFRQKHIAAGGEGAPLAVYGDYLLFSKKGANRIMLNIGGIANFTFLPGNLNPALVFSTDIGPGNTMMDAFTQQHFPGEYFDKNAAIAKRGKVNMELLNALKENKFFQLPFPKTTGPELFNLGYLEDATKRAGITELSSADCMNTLNQFSADMIIDAINKNSKDVNGFGIYCSGGGMHNPLLMERLKKKLPDCKFYTTGVLGIDPDAKEAVLFAILANEAVAGDPNVFSSGNMPAISMGKISLPS
ncbi:anhydro-N-acetylmuramic acid kinase AnmK [soil metagenome]